MKRSHNWRLWIGLALAGMLPPPASARAQDAPLAYVSNERSGTITIINTATDEVVGTIAVGPGPRGIQVNPVANRVYVALSDLARTVETDADAIAEIDIASGKILRRLPAGSDPEQFAVSPDGLRLFASNEDAGTVSIIDLDTEQVIATLTVGIEPEGVAISPDGRWVYVTAETSNTVSRSEEHTSELQSRENLVCRLLLEKKKPKNTRLN